MFLYHNCNDFGVVVKECKGCEYITTRITNGDKICSYSRNPSNEWFWSSLYPCPRATHIKKEGRVNMVKEKEEIQFQNIEFINEIKKNSNPSKVSFLQERGKILEGLSRNNYLEGMYENVIKAFYTSYLKPGDVVVDCGAEVGHHTFPLADVVGPEGIVYAIDARPESTVQIKKKMQSSQRNILLFNCALSDWEGETDFTTADGLPGWSSLVPYDKYPQEVTLRQHKVKVHRLDHIVDKTHEVKFIKLDIEGGEYHALIGAEEIISRHRPLLVFENGWLGAANRYNYLVKDFIDFFAQNGFELFDILGEPFTSEFLITSHFINNFIAVPDESAQKYAGKILNLSLGT